MSVFRWASCGRCGRRVHCRETGEVSSGRTPPSSRVPELRVLQYGVPAISIGQSYGQGLAVAGSGASTSRILDERGENAVMLIEMHLAMTSAGWSGSGSAWPLFLGGSADSIARGWGSVHSHGATAAVIKGGSRPPMQTTTRVRIPRLQERSASSAASVVCDNLFASTIRHEHPRTR